jgi:hypothetical protein
MSRPPPQVLNWWVRTLLTATSTFDAERQLADYCLARRNPLSAVAAIELALWKVRRTVLGGRGTGGLGAWGTVWQ